MIKINNICIRDMKTSGDKFVKKISHVIAACILGVTFFSVTGCGTSSSAGSQSTEAAVKEAAVQDTQAVLKDKNQSEVNSENGSDKAKKQEENNIKKHNEPPVIYGVEDKTYYVGEKASYMSDVYAVDDTQQEIDVEVDKSQVDNSVPGDYIVYYKAVDSEGNETTREAVYSFKEEETQATQQEAESLEQIVAIVLSEITDDSMSMGEKARAVFNYAHGKIGYSYNNYGGYDWQSEAYYALKDIEKSGYIGGDCFTYCSVDLALMQGIGADCIWVDNMGASTGEHSWLLCNVGSGWYHFDATRMYDKFECFMLTDAQIQAYIDRGNSIYNRDMSAYPATPSENFSY